MKRDLKPVEWGGLILLAAVFAVGSPVYSKHAERRLAQEAVRNVAGGAGTLWIVKASRYGGRSALWCAMLERPDGLVAVVTRHDRLPFMEEVVEVAPAWVGLRTPYETDMLEACRTAVASGSPALP